MPLSKYLNIIKPSEECLTNPLEPAMTFPFPLDNFQKHAINAISKDENVLITANTGSGKTLIAEYQIAHSLKNGKRVFYTTPIKSLSNQKFHDLKKMFPSVGIITGDIKFNPTADIIICTTEILQNLLYKQGTITENIGLTASLSLENVDSVIFDEVHYINNRERGGVWEQTLILLPKHINLVLLSATIDSADLFASWIGDLKEKSIHLITTSHRVVPLTHNIIRNDSFEVVMDEKEQFHSDAYNRWIYSKLDASKKKAENKILVNNRRLGGYEEPVVKKGESTNYLYTINSTIQTFYNLDMLPCLFFVFSRKNCEAYANKVAGSLITPSESAEVKHIIEFHLHRFKENVQIVNQYHKIVSLLERGIAFHHSGLLPLLKEIVEILFSKGLVKVLFATETFAVGLNMPTKTVVFTSYRKYDEYSDSLRILTRDEYLQMAGRAGRRGKDKKGYIFYLPDREPETVEDVKKMMTGNKTKLQSRLKIQYEFLLKTVQLNISWIDLIKTSYYYEQVKIQLSLLEKEYEEKKTILSLLNITEKQLYDLHDEIKLEEQIKTLSNAPRKRAQKEYDIWVKEHDDRVWNPLRKIYKQYVELNSSILELHREIKYSKDINYDIEPYLQVLKKFGFLNEDNSLTIKGIYATEINEGNQILIANIYERGELKDLNQQEILLILTCFLEKDEKSEEIYIPKTLNYIIENIEKDISLIEKEENKFNIPYIKREITLQYLGLLNDLFNGSSISDICSKYEIYEGNLSKFLLKLLNIVEEIKNIATLQKDISLLEKLENVKDLEFYKFAICESLYLRI